MIFVTRLVDQQENYRKSGFALAYRNIRQQGIAAYTEVVAPEIVPLSAVAFNVLKGFDRSFFPVSRDAFLKGWIEQKNAIGSAYVQDAQLRGYAVVRPCRGGWKFGPLFAETPFIAEALFTALQNKIPAGETFFIDTPELNRSALDLAQKYRLSQVFETARMYRGTAPEVNLDGICGVTTFELG